ncbi:hypothetical protein AgCh_003409 [Apium graveolens]
MAIQSDLLNQPIMCVSGMSENNIKTTNDVGDVEAESVSQSVEKLRRIVLKTGGNPCIPQFLAFHDCHHRVHILGHKWRVPKSDKRLYHRLEACWVGLTLEQWRVGLSDMSEKKIKTTNNVGDVEAESGGQSVEKLRRIVLRTGGNPCIPQFLAFHDCHPRVHILG